MLEHTLLNLGVPLAPGDLSRVTDAQGLVVLAHADGGARTSQRVQGMLQRLQLRRYSTLDFDLLTHEEAADPRCVENVDLLAQRLEQALEHLPVAMRQVPLGVLGSDTGTAAAIAVAVRKPRSMRALVSRSGRPDLASDVLGALRTPTLLIVGAGDPPLVEANRAAYAALRAPKRIDVVPRASHNFLEAGTLDIAAQLAGDWFDTHLTGRG